MRTWRGYLAIQLAEMIGVNRQTISMYENGKLDNPEFCTIQKFSESLQFPFKFFLEDTKVEVEKSTTYFRSLLTTNKKYRVEQEDKINFIAVIYNMLNEYLEFEKLNLPQIPQNTTPQENAELLRKHWKLAHDLENIDKEDFKNIEQEAHSFAAAFLLPEKEFAEDVRPYATNLAYYVELKKRWKVSIAAMIRRVKDLGVITNDDYSKLKKQGIRKIEPLDNELMTAEPSLL